MRSYLHSHNLLHTFAVYALIIVTGALAGYYAVKIITAGLLLHETITSIRYLSNGVHVSLFIIGIILVSYTLFPQGRKNIFQPQTLGVIVMSIIWLLGIINCYISEKVFPTFRISMTNTHYYWGACMIFFLIGCRLTTGKVVSPVKKLYSWDRGRLCFITLVIFAFSTLGTVYAIHKIGLIPIFKKGGIELARFDYSEQVGRVWHVSMCGTVSAILAAVYMMRFKKRYVTMSVVCLISLFNTLIYGQRFCAVMGLAVILLTYHYYVKRITLKFLVPLFGGLLAALTVYIYKRYGMYIREIEHLSFIEKIFYFSSTEWRELAWAIENYSDYKDFLWGKSLINIIIPALPTQIWALAGIDKAHYLSINSAALLMNIRGFYAGLRVGLPGEFYLNFGYFGILCMIPLGYLFGIIGNMANRLDRNDARLVLLNFVLFNLVFGFIGQINTIFETLYRFGYILLFVLIVCIHRSTTQDAATRQTQ